MLISTCITSAASLEATHCMASHISPGFELIGNVTVMRTNPRYIRIHSYTIFVAIRIQQCSKFGSLTQQYMVMVSQNDSF